MCEFELVNTCKLGAAPSAPIRSRWRIQPLSLEVHRRAVCVLNWLLAIAGTLPSQ